jgi:dTDP-4-amino-4,6-dideoxygalactose transaminase
VWNIDMRKDMETRKLAIFGGNPVFDQPLHVGRPNIGDRREFLERVEAILDAKWLTNRGPQVREFEAQLARFTGVRHCIAMCNATVALEIVTRALGMSGEVIVPSMTFVATAHALQWQQITPVFCDIGRDTHTLDVARVESMITPRTSGILAVHLWGRPCDIEGLTNLARRHNLRLVFDAAHAFGCSHKNRMIGGFGDAEVFSFHATKVMNTFEGGAVMTNDDALAEKIRLMQNFGFSGYDNVVHIGTNGKMSEVSAAMGLVSMNSLDQFVGVNRRNYHQYRSLLGSLPGVSIISYNEDERCNYQYVVLLIDDAVSGIRRDVLLQVLHAENILARRYFYPGCHRMEPYKSYFPHINLLLPETERVLERVLILPTGTAVGESDIDIICDVIHQAVAEAAAISEHIGSTALAR